MASVTGSTIRISASPIVAMQKKSDFSGHRLVSFTRKSIRTVPRLRISCAAKPDTIEKVCKIVKKQLALDDKISVTGESKFSDLGADSLDTVEIVMGLEEAFGISVEEDGAQSIATVQDAADMIEKIVEAQ